MALNSGEVNGFTPLDLLNQITQEDSLEKFNYTKTRAKNVKAYLESKLQEMDI